MPPPWRLSRARRSATHQHSQRTPPSAPKVVSPRACMLRQSKSSTNAWPVLQCGGRSTTLKTIHTYLAQLRLLINFIRHCQRRRIDGVGRKSRLMQTLWIWERGVTKSLSLAGLIQLLLQIAECGRDRTISAVRGKASARIT